MDTQILLAIVTIFVSVAVAGGTAVNMLLTQTSPERRRIRDVGKGQGSVVLDAPRLEESLSPTAERVATWVPKSPKEISNIRRQLTTAGYRHLSAAVYFSAAKIALPIALGFIALVSLGISRGVLAIVGGAVVGFFLPDLWLSRKIRLRQKAIRNGLPDALDLLIVCLEAGSSLDQSIVKASHELEVAHPALADELMLITTEIRAGKPRLEALKNFADRTKVADVRSLVSMLVQTDKFGTSVAQALRTHAEISRTQRRQRAEERAAKIGVKLVFPLVFLLFPALYIVILGPAAIRFVRVFSEMASRGPLR